MEGSYGMNSLAIVILNWNGSEDTIECLKGLQDIKSYDIYLLDNGSHKNQQEKIKNYIKSEQCPVKFKIVNLDDEYNGANAYYIISADGGSIYLTETSLADAFSKTIEELTVTEDTESTETVENTEE